MKHTIPTIIFILALLSLIPSATAQTHHQEKRLPGGCIQIPGLEGRTLPLLHTDVRTQIDGILAQTTLVQTFKNDTSNTLELTYIFPMPHRAAIGHYQFKIGDRTIVGTIQTKSKAREMYEQARAEGKTAALLEQQRPNVFTQNLTNIPAGATIEVQIKYDEVLVARDGQMEWVLPMVVGPRFMPEKTAAQSFTNPKYAWPDTRSANTLSLEVTLGNGATIASVGSSSHSILVQRGKQVSLSLDKKKAIPNKDFILNFTYAYRIPEIMVSSYLDPKNPANSSFLLTLLPPNPKALENQVMAREFFFILDVSGSMYGQPMEKAIATLKACMASLRPDDTFQIMTFAGSTAFFKPQPVHPTRQFLEEAMQFLDSRQGGGGTYMLKAIEKALTAEKDPERYRMAVMFTDGYIGNESEIITAIKGLKASSRVFGFGIGSSVNRYLIEAMGRAGNGFSEIVPLNADLNQTARRWENKLRSPILTDLQLNISGGEVSDLQPAQLPDLFAGDPIMITGHYRPNSKLTIMLNGKKAGKPFEINKVFDLGGSSNPVVPKIWARERIRDLEFDLMNPQKRHVQKETEQEITQLGLNYRLLTAFTSFVAIDSQSKVSTEGRIHSDVEVPLPEGVSPRMLGRSMPKKVAFNQSVMSPAPTVKYKESLERFSAADEVGSIMEERIQPILEREEKDKAAGSAKQEQRQVSCQLLYQPGQPQPIGLILFLDSADQVKGFTLKGQDGQSTIQLSPKLLKAAGKGQFHLLFKDLKEMQEGTWILNFGDGQTFEFTR